MRSNNVLKPKTTKFKHFTNFYSILKMKESTCRKEYSCCNQMTNTNSLKLTMRLEWPINKNNLTRSLSSMRR